ncbi:MAG: gliding motility protein GldL [Bacteroidaceae bacterium]|nr:gliding motility protein GldL [Bacteroidaceae bacterium]
MASKLNPIARIQKWMDTFAGQTFMQYAYSWGAAVVILGTLFKLTHIPGANLMLFVGMGTEVFVFFIAAFERVTEKPSEAEQAAQNQQSGVVVNGMIGTPVVGGTVVTGAPVVGTPMEGDENGTPVEGVAQNGPVVIGGGQPGVVYTGSPVVASGPVLAGGPVMAGGPVVAGGTVVAAPGASVVEGQPVNMDPEALAAGAGLSAAAANLAAAGQAAAEAQLALSQLQGGGAINPAAIKATDPAAIEEAVKNYAEELTELTEVLGRVKVQAARMSTDSEEMENLNRTLTGIATVYELQLRNISKQVATIEQIDEQTKRMAKQIEELNNVYARMIAALTVNMGGGAPVAPVTPAPES